MADEHSIKAAMARNELNEDEAFFILRFAGHLGYDAAIRRLNPDPWWTRARQWVVRWSETPHLLRWDEGLPVRRKGRDVTPLSLFGGRITFQWFGVDINAPGGFLCIRWRQSVNGPLQLRVFLSPNATPWAATRWLVGKP